VVIYAVFCSCFAGVLIAVNANVDVMLQVILLLFGMEFLWRKSGDLMAQYGYGSEYEVITAL